MRVSLHFQFYTCHLLSVPAIILTELKMDAESGGSALSSPSDVTMSEGASPQERKIQDIKGGSAPASTIEEKKNYISVSDIDIKYKY